MVKFPATWTVDEEIITKIRKIAESTEQPMSAVANRVLRKGFGVVDEIERLKLLDEELKELKKLIQKVINKD